MNFKNPFNDGEDNLLFAKALDRLNSAQKKGAAFTDFLDPARCEKFFEFFSKRGITVAPYGGHENAERKMLGFFAAGEEIFPISPLTFTFNEKFSKPLHRDFLGAVLGLGLERGKIGDILLGEAGAVIYVHSGVAEFICENLRQAGRAAVKGKIGGELPGIETQGAEKRITVASLRVDAVISSAFNFSRGKAAALIDSEKVFVNWKPAKKTQQVSTGDMITIRGKGRVAIGEIEGNTKKGRIILRIIF